MLSRIILSLRHHAKLATPPIHGKVRNGIQYAQTIITPYNVNLVITVVT
ncbi:MAG: hypothetical protein WC313_08230 [Candidatus Kapaibacterium sp.]|nr:hypothetical protein [Candidatus Kapabacteria bacterium]